MNSIRAAFYARVSSEQQATAHTIGSQLAALSERAQADGSPVPLVLHSFALQWIVCAIWPP
jgi:DNA invertase Pin-like site-specific DNA recombinase